MSNRALLQNQPKPEVLIFDEVTFGTPLFDELLSLRNEVLRIPLGLEFTSEDIGHEWVQHHLALYNTKHLLLGCITFVQDDDHTYRMRQVAVRPGHQGLGYGRVLVERGEQWIRQRLGSDINLCAREQAIPFYEKLGYEVYGEPFTEVNLPHRHMRKSL